MGYPMFTVGGYNFYEVSSAFQKSIRRGLEHEALYWGTELFLSNFDEYAWFRMKVIASEDVGLADSNVVVQIDTLYRIYDEMKKKKNKHKPEKLQFTHALLILIRCKKSRLVDNKLCYYFFQRQHIEKLEIPDFAYDMHTHKGKQLGRGNDFFYAESAKITNENFEACPDEYEFRDFMWDMYNKEDGVTGTRAKHSGGENEQPGEQTKLEL